MGKEFKVTSSFCPGLSALFPRCTDFPLYHLHNLVGLLQVGFVTISLCSINIGTYENNGPTNTTHPAYYLLYVLINPIPSVFIPTPSSDSHAELTTWLINSEKLRTISKTRTFKVQIWLSLSLRLQSWQCYEKYIYIGMPESSPKPGWELKGGKILAKNLRPKL